MLPQSRDAPSADLLHVWDPFANAANRAAATSGDWWRLPGSGLRFNVVRAGMTRHAIRVGRLRRDRGISVARPTVLGNPFTIGVDGDRADVIAKYRHWLMRELRLNGAVRAAVERLRLAASRGEITLLCFCAPKPCHADVIAELLGADAWPPDDPNGDTGAAQRDERAREVDRAQSGSGRE